jgi:hypothetical protein
MDKASGCLEKLFRSSYSRHEKLFRQTAREFAFNKDIIRACDGSAMNSEQATKWNHPRCDGLPFVCQRRPPLTGCHFFP